MMRNALLGAVVLLVCVACSSAKPEAASLVASVETFHRASNDERPARADALGLIVCKDAEVCAAKAACVEATTATAKALRLKREVEAALADVEAGKKDAHDSGVEGLTAKLDQASLLLKQGRDAMPACDQKILVLRERYGL
jgi:hypothetical protein